MRWHFALAFGSLRLWLSADFQLLLSYQLLFSARFGSLRIQHRVRISAACRANFIRVFVFVPAPDATTADLYFNLG
jgi:hypothetical protein